MSTKRWQNVAVAKGLLERVTWQLKDSPDATLTSEEKRAILLQAAEEMQKAQIVLKGPTFTVFEDGVPKKLPLAYDVLFDQINNKIKPDDIPDVADTLLESHSEFSNVKKGGRYHTKKQRRRKGKKSRRSTRRS